MTKPGWLISLLFSGFCIGIMLVSYPFSPRKGATIPPGLASAAYVNSPQALRLNSIGNQNLTTQNLGAGVQPSLPHDLLQEILRFLAGGCLGHYLWPRLLGYTPIFLRHSGCWPPGLLDFTIVFGLGFITYHLLTNRRKKVELPPPTPDFLAPLILQPVELTVSKQAAPGLASLRAGDPDFHLPAFGDYVRQTIKTQYTHWNQGELDKLEGILSEDLLNFLRMGHQILRLRGEIHRLENLSLRHLIIVEAGAADGQDFIVVCVKGRLIDYVVQRHSLKLLAGSMTYPKEWEEFWRFERPSGKKTWLLTDIKEF